MQARIAIGTPVRPLRTVLSLAGAGAIFVCGVTVWDMEPLLAGVLLVIGGLWGTVTLGILFVRRWLRRSVVMLDNGFQVVDRHGTRQYQDHQVSGIALKHKDRYSHGVLWATDRICTLWLESEWETHRIVLRRRILTGDTDALSPLIHRLEANLLSRIQDRHLQGELIEGEGWNLFRRELQFGSPPNQTQIDINDLHAVEEIDGRICLWCSGDLHPTGRIDRRSRNASILHQLLQDEVQHVHSAQHLVDAAPHDELGRILFERRAKRSIVVAWSALSAVIQLVGVIFAIGAIADREFGMGVVSGVTFLLAAFVALIAYKHYHTVIRGHANGVSKSGLRSESHLLFRDIDAVTYAGVAHYVKGVYSGTQYELLFEPAAESGHSAIHYSTAIKQPDAALEMLRDRASASIAARMQLALEQGWPVIWTRQLRLLDKAVEYRAKNWWGRLRPPILIDYSAITGAGMEGELYCIWTNYQESAVVKIPTNDANFYAGKLLLDHLLANATVPIRRTL